MPKAKKTTTKAKEVIKTPKTKKVVEEKPRLSEEEKVAHVPEYDPDMPLNKQRHLR